MLYVSGRKFSNSSDPSITAIGSRKQIICAPAPINKRVYSQ